MVRQHGELWAKVPGSPMPALCGCRQQQTYTNTHKTYKMRLIGERDGVH